MTRMYEDGTYLANNPSWHVEDSAWKAGQIVKIIEQNSIEVTTIGEVGCGAGEVLRQFSRLYTHASKFVGYEVSPQAFEICSKKSAPNLSFRLGDFFSCTDDVFDLVLAIDVFEHVENYFDFLRRIRLKGTYKVFHIPLDISVQSVLRAAPIMKSRRTVGHIHYFTKDLALASLEDTGHTILDYFYTGSSLELPNLGWRAELMKIPRELAFKVDSDMAVRILGGYSLLVLTE